MGHIHTNQRRYNTHNSPYLNYNLWRNRNWELRYVCRTSSAYQLEKVRHEWCNVVQLLWIPVTCCVLIAPHCTTHVVPLHTNRCIPKGQTHPPLLLSPSDGVVGSRLHLPGVPTVLTDDEIFSDEGYGWHAPIITHSLVPPLQRMLLAQNGSALYWIKSHYIPPL